MQPSFIQLYARSVWDFARIAAALLAVFLLIRYGPGVLSSAIGTVLGAMFDAFLTIIETLLSPFDMLLDAGTPEDPMWDVPLDLPGANGACADPDAVGYDAPISGQRVYQTKEGC